MTTAITKSDRIIKVVSREEQKSTITTFFDKVGKYTNADYIAGMTDGYALEEYQKLRW